MGTAASQVTPLACRLELRLDCGELAEWRGFSGVHAVSIAQFVRCAVKHAVATEGWAPEPHPRSVLAPVGRAALLPDGSVLPSESTTLAGHEPDRDVVLRVLQERGFEA